MGWMVVTTPHTIPGRDEYMSTPVHFAVAIPLQYRSLSGKSEVRELCFQSYCSVSIREPLNFSVYPQS